ncbi:MAG: hypothetical protein JKY67_12360 [Pseudomonadales bacterium]|nr:hypothetical protein [Pseudomonadales bacterium]
MATDTEFLKHLYLGDRICVEDQLLDNSVNVSVDGELCIPAELTLELPFSK